MVRSVGQGTHGQRQGTGATYDQPCGGHGAAILHVTTLSMLPGVTSLRARRVGISMSTNVVCVRSGGCRRKLRLIILYHVVV